jgi:hypothetical protein
MLREALSIRLKKSFFKRMIERRSASRRKKFKLHRTVLNWLPVSYGEKEKF